MTITEILVPAQDIVWLPWAVQYFFYVGSAYAATILFFIALVFRQQSSHHFRSALVLVMAIGAIVGPLALTADLHQPGRVWHFFVHLTPWSWMSLGSLFLPLFSVLSVLTAWLYLRSDIAELRHSNQPLVRWVSALTLGKWKTSHQQIVVMAGLTLISGLSIALYTGAEFAAIASRPQWAQLASPIIWFISAFLAAIGLVLLIGQCIPEIDHNTSQGLTLFDQTLIKRTTGLSAFLSMILLPIWASNRSSFSLLENPDWVINFSVIFCTLIACVLMAKYTLTLMQSVIGRTVFILTTVAAAWSIRWVTMIEVQTIARFDAGTYPYELPMDASGLLGIVGMFGLWIALALLASELINYSEEPSSASMQS